MALLPLESKPLPTTELTANALKLPLPATKLTVASICDVPTALICAVFAFNWPLAMLELLPTPLKLAL